MTSAPSPRKFSRTARAVSALDGAGDRAWFLPVVSAFPLADYVLPFLPNQILLVALCVLQPRRWWHFGIVFILAGALGAVLATLAIQTLGSAALEGLGAGKLDGNTVAELALMIESHGLWALALLAMLPWPPRTAVVICALAGISPIEVGIAVGFGRIVPTAVNTILAAKAPQVFKRLRSVSRVLEEVAALRKNARDSLRQASPGSDDRPSGEIVVHSVENR